MAITCHGNPTINWIHGWSDNGIGLTKSLGLTFENNLSSWRTDPSSAEKSLHPLLRRGTQTAMHYDQLFDWDKGKDISNVNSTWLIVFLVLSLLYRVDSCMLEGPCRATPVRK